MLTTLFNISFIVTHIPGIDDRVVDLLSLQGTTSCLASYMNIFFVPFGPKYIEIICY